MRKFKSILILSLLFNLNSFAAINYSFVASSGIYTANASPTVIHGANIDDALSAAINIGFTFNYGGCTSTAYTQLKVSSNGWLSFAHPGTSNSATNDLSLTTLGKVVAPLWDDLQTGAAGNVNYKLTGTAPNRVFTVEWKQMKWYWGAGGPGISFQAKLHETSNKIEFVYSQEATAVASGSASIGLNGAAAGDYYSLNGTGASPSAIYGTQTSNLNTKPATGQIYTWNAPTTMTYVSSAVSQPNTSDVYVGTTNQDILRIEVAVSGGCTPFALTQLIFNMIGTTALTDVTNVDVYYTGTIPIFTASTLFGSVAPSAGNITLNGSQTLQEGSNYFWIVYDISSSATLLDFLDAGNTQITVNGVNRTPTGNPPAGNRQIVDAPPSFSKWVEKGWARSVIAVSNDDLVWVGHSTNTYSSGGSDMHIMKTDKDATSVIWSTVIGSAVGSERANDLVKTNDGYIMTGYTTSFGAGGWDIIVAKVDLSGVHQWTKTIGSTSSTDEAYSIILTSDGNVAICGQMYIGAETKGYFAQINQSTGAIIAEKFLNPSIGLSLYDLKQTSDGGFILVGSNNSAGNNDFFIMKLTSSLVNEYAYRWGSGSNDQLFGVIENSVNDFTVFGSTYGFGSGSRDGYAMRFTVSGTALTPVWMKAYGTADANSFNCVSADPSGNYGLTGITTRLGDPLDNEAWFVKIDASSGNALTYKSIGTTNTGEDQEGYGICSLSDGSFAIAGLHNDAIGANFYMSRISSGAYSCASIKDNGSVTNLASTTFTSDNFLSALTSTFANQTPTLGNGAVIVNHCGTIPVVLPISLLHFDGIKQDENNFLFWETASERNNDYFTIERSQNGIDWEIVDYVDGAGNSNSILNYSLVDSNPFYPITYYKLKQTDFDGKFTYSNIIALTRSNSNEIFSSLYPNPTNEQFNFEYSGKKEKFKCEIFNALGDLIYEQEFIGLNKIENIDIASFSKGLYFVKFTQNEFITTKKIIKN